MWNGCNYLYYVGVGCLVILATSKVVEWYLILYCYSVDIPLGVSWKRYLSRSNIIGRIKSLDNDYSKLNDRVHVLERKNANVLIAE
jgi:hypothetical protein